MARGKVMASERNSDVTMPEVHKLCNKQETNNNW